MTTAAELFEQHRTMAIQLKQLKVDEMKLRIAIVENLCAGKDLGTHTFSMEGFIIKAKTSVGYSLDQEIIQEMIADDVLSDEELDCLATKYQLKLGDYKRSGETDNLDEAVMVKPAAPTLEIVLGEL